MAKIMICFLLLLFPIVHSYTDGAINLLVRSTRTSDTYRYCIELAKLPNDRIVNITDFGWYSPYLTSTSVNVCNLSNMNNSLPTSLSPKTMIIVYEYECTMTEHAWNIEKRFGQQISLMIITKRTDTAFELTYNSTAMPVTIPVVVFLDTDFTRINDKNNIQLSIDYPVETPKKFRPAILLMYLLILFVLLGGNFWAASEFKKNIDTNSHLSNSNTTPRIDETVPVQIIVTQNSVASSESPKEKGIAILPMTCCFIILMISFSVGWLLLLYFFPQVMIHILQVLFGISAFSSLTSCLNRLSYFVPILRRYKTPSHTYRKPCLCQLGPLNLITILAMAISLTLVIIWYVYRQKDWVWVLQNILGAAVCITVTSIYRLGNMRVITIILVAFFLYDIFFVFITPYIPIFQKSSSSDSTTVAPSSGSSGVRTVSRKSSRNPSVIEQVALGIGANGEAVPLLFALPIFIPESELDPCVAVRKSMIGFGDIILPGILLTFCKIFDIASANRWPIYYIQSLISYFVGLSLTYVALYLMETAQPALLYIVPCILLSTIITSLFRRELKELYTGKRLQSALEGTPAKPIVPLNDIEDNPNEQQTIDQDNSMEQEINSVDNLAFQQTNNDDSVNNDKETTGVYNHSRVFHIT